MIFFLARPGSSDNVDKLKRDSISTTMLSHDNKTLRVNAVKALRTKKKGILIKAVNQLLLAWSSIRLVL